ncbi:hypothetical protein MKK68_16580 [Methylobacterium sp. E-016]|uniref:hypothetical protein n=1 Tax=Methylobacterium sp. E-016 TaxID=2836556 RepID=UPI001FBBAE95|nr:hypothetical protein [Methylobacterium sp. E-016]MCJ2077243.1 hypothetical protein [Methylobacterium sp. E-016]
MSADDASFDLHNRRKRTVVGLATALEVACRDFEILGRMLDNEIRVVADLDCPEFMKALENVRINGTIHSALVQSFVFNAARAVRICEQGASLLLVNREHRRTFQAALKALGDARDINEHGYDPKDQPRRKNLRAQMHLHEAGGVAVDETSLIIGGSKDILMGPINLYETYLAVSRFRAVAGFRSLPPEYTAS